MSKNNTAIVPKSEIFLEMDRLDQQQIILAATGEIVDELVYQVKNEWGLSWAGINHIAFWMGDIKTEPWVNWERVQMFGDRMYWSATVRAVNDKYNLASLGTAEAPELMEVYDRDPKGNKIPDGQGGFKQHLEPDPFCRRKALSMAQRNAKRAVTPEAVLKKWLQYFVDRKKGKQVETPFSPKTVDAEYEVLDKPKKKPTVKAPEPKPASKVDSEEERVKATLEGNGVDTQFLLIVKYGDKVHIGVQDGYDQIGWIDDHKVITKLLKGVWVQENTRWEVPPQ